MMTVMIIYLIVMMIIIIGFSIIGGRHNWSGTKIGNWQIGIGFLWAAIVMLYIHFYVFDVIVVLKSFFENH